MHKSGSLRSYPNHLWRYRLMICYSHFGRSVRTIRPLGIIAVLASVFVAVAISEAESTAYSADGNGCIKTDNLHLAATESVREFLECLGESYSGVTLRACEEKMYCNICTYRTDEGAEIMAERDTGMVYYYRRGRASKHTGSIQNAAEAYNRVRSVINHLGLPNNFQLYTIKSLPDGKHGKEPISWLILKDLKSDPEPYRLAHFGAAVSAETGAIIDVMYQPAIEPAPCATTEITDQMALSVFQGWYESITIPEGLNVSIHGCDEMRKVVAFPQRRGSLMAWKMGLKRPPKASAPFYNTSFYCWEIEVTIKGGHRLSCHDDCTEDHTRNELYWVNRCTGEVIGGYRGSFSDTPVE